MRTKFIPKVQITSEALELIRLDDDLLYKLALRLNKDIMSVKRWLRDPRHHRFLVEKKALAIIAEHLGVHADTITEPITIHA